MIAMCPFSEPRDYLLLIFELWIIDAHTRTCGVHGTRLFFRIVIHPRTGAWKETVPHTLLKNSCTCVGVSRMREQLGIQIERKKEVRSSGTTTLGNPARSLKAMRDVWKWISRRREDTRISLRNALASNIYDVNRGKREKYYYTWPLKREILSYIILHRVNIE